MGLDAPSEDLTTRIARRRAALLREGLVEPARPGEHMQFRGGGHVAAPHVDFQPEADTRVVPVDETPERGGAAALAETSVTDGVGPLSTQTEEPAQAAEVTGEALPSDSVESLVNEFGDEYDPNDDGGFDFGEEPEQASTEVLQAEPAAEVESVSPADPPAPAKKRTRSNVAAERHAEIVRDLEAIEDWLRQGNVAHVEEMAAIQRRFDDIDKGLLLIAQFVSKLSVKPEAQEDPREMYDTGESPRLHPPVYDVEIPSFLREPEKHKHSAFSAYIRRGLGLTD